MCNWLANKVLPNGAQDEMAVRIVRVTGLYTGSTHQTGENKREQICSVVIGFDMF